MEKPFSDQLYQIADSMGIALYQRFSLEEGALFLRCPISDLEKLKARRKIAFIQLTDGQTEFFGYQLLEYLLGQIQPAKVVKNTAQDPSERILNSKEVQELTNLSRTTLWRLERAGKFPARIPLTSSRIGWRYSEVQSWLNGC